MPQHVAFIMDGNRRFAQANNLQKIEGHSKVETQSHGVFFSAWVVLHIDIDSAGL